MSDRLKKILLYGVASPACFLGSLLIGAYFTFPYDHLREYIVQEAERTGKIHMEITSLAPSWLTGAEVEGVRVAIVPDDPEEQPPEVVIRKADARVSLLALLSGTPDVSFHVEMDGGGTIAGAYAQGPETMHVEARFHRVDLRRIGPLRAAVPLPIGGRLDGDVDMTIGREIAKTAGSADLTVHGLSVGDGHTAVQVQGLSSGLTLERMNLGDLHFALETEEGVSRIQELHADGEHAELWGTGALRLIQPLARSSADLLIRIHFKDAYRTSSDRMEGLFALLEMSPQVAPARREDGSLQWRIQGSFGGRMRMVPSGRTPMPGVDD